MGFNFNGIAGSEVTIDGNVKASYPTDENSLIATASFTTGNGTTTIYTVPANKVFYLSKIISLTNSGWAGRLDWVVNGAIIANSNGGINTQIDLAPAIKLTAGQTIQVTRVYTSGAYTQYASVIGWLEDA